MNNNGTPPKTSSPVSTRGARHQQTKPPNRASHNPSSPKSRRASGANSAPIFSIASRESMREAAWPGSNSVPPTSCTKPFHDDGW